jgi:S1-C subfamily serine protease
MTFRNLRRFAVVLLIGFGGLAMATQPLDPVPSLESLKALRFTKINAPDRPEMFSYADILDVITSGSAYARGRVLLPNYHEPIPTRGPSGVSLFRRISPSVVLVMTGTYKNDELTDLGIGTGALIDSAGYVLTNWHVMNGYQVAVIFFKPASGTELSEQGAFGARLVAQDPAADLALLKISKLPSGLNPIKLGEISNVQVAEDIHIIGHPHGLFWPYSTGVISQVRENYKWTYSDGSKHSAKVLQMQTAINPGNSGGPVLDDNGNILGLVAMSEEGQNLNYAIAVDEIKTFVSGAMGARTRGTKERVSPAALEWLSAETETGLKISKVVYKDLTAYYVADSKSSPIGLQVECSDGTTVAATKPNGLGGFDNWLITLANGKKVVVHSNGTAPETIGSD